MVTNVDCNGYPIYVTCNNDAACITTFLYCQPTYGISTIGYRLQTNHKSYFDEILSAKTLDIPVNLTEEEVEKCLDEDPTIFDGVKLNIIKTE